MDSTEVEDDETAVGVVVEVVGNSTGPITARTGRNRIGTGR